VSSQRESLFPDDSNLKVKLRKVYKYLFQDFPFGVTNLDYEEYWDRLSQETCPVSLFKLNLIKGIINEGSSVLDIGCGDGTLLHHLSEAKQIKAHGIEISTKAIELAREKGVIVHRADITKEGFQLAEVHDYIIISEVLEHLPNPEQLMLKLKGRFEEYLIITIPNSGFIGERLRLLLGRFPKQWALHPSEHLRFWTVKDFIFWCHQLGYRVESYRGLFDEFYDIKIKLWKYYPNLFSRYVLYIIKEAK